jgi:hypothetical protein
MSNEKNMKAFWDQRYSQEGYAYGETPNDYFKHHLAGIPAGKMLLPAEGEGRNAVFAATLGWEVYAFDLSDQGKRKAELLAEKHHVTIHFQVGECKQMVYPEKSFDMMALVYAHFDASEKTSYHRQLLEYVKKDGLILFEAYSKKHADFQRRNPFAGGPREIDMLFDLEEIKRDFADVDFIELREEQIDLHEGPYHSGKAMVIRFLGKKK